ncbi:MAG: hypothetical protein S4CHLAM123_12400 [Chlamydiales bacterium]|nr:hypothetical protein [Chlamydiales bacterium]
MSDVSAISSAHKLQSQKMVSIETQKGPNQVSESNQMQKMNQLEDGMKQVEQGFALVKEIEQSLKAQLEQLSS